MAQGPAFALTQQPPAEPLPLEFWVHHQLKNLCVPGTRDVADQGKQTKTNGAGGYLSHKDCMRWTLKQLRETLDDLLTIDLVAEMWKQTGDGDGIFKRCSAHYLAHGKV
jgi:hypothetical protein